MKALSSRIWILLAFLGVGIGFCAWSLIPLLSSPRLLPSTRILARDESLLYELSSPKDGFRQPVVLADLSPATIQALLATEDARFYQHHGIDWRALAREIKNVVTRGGVSGGASTLEQQLVKNLYFSRTPRTFSQKARELLAARVWSLAHTKVQTLERYLNTIYFGRQAYGIEAGSLAFFRKSARDLDTAEAAMLMGFIHAPSFYDPLAHPEKAYARSSWVLGRMQTLGFLSATSTQEFRAERLAFAQPRQAIFAPHFVFHVLQEVEAMYPDAAYGGYQIQTTLDPAYQREAENSISRRLAKLREEHAGNAAALAMDPRSGEVLAYVGSADYFEIKGGQVDMVQALRQPGSSLKPFLYFAAFLKKYTPATILADTPARFETSDGKAYYPHNYSQKYHGPVSIREALGNSFNIPAVRMLHTLGVPAFMSILARFGILFPEPPDHYGLSLVLGGGEASLWDITSAYASLVQISSGASVRDILSIKTSGGRELFSLSPRLSLASLFADTPNAPRSAALITDILSDPSARLTAFGESSMMNMGRGVAVKTGTTKDFKDNWAFGYSEDTVVGVWVGNADGEPMRGVSGTSGAVPIWHDLMAYRENPSWAKPRALPDGIVSLAVCAASGLRASETCPKIRTELFIKGTEPTKAHSASASSTAVQILSPLDGDRFVIDESIDRDSQRIPFAASGGAPPYRWRLNGQWFVSDQPVFLWNPTPGAYTLEVETGSRQIRFLVR